MWSLTVRGQLTRRRIARIAPWRLVADPGTTLDGITPKRIEALAVSVQLELGHSRKDVPCQSARGRTGIDVLSDRDHFSSGCFYPRVHVE
jgi:hypothetical protein